jgi:hypothetical protein
MYVTEHNSTPIRPNKGQHITSTSPPSSMAMDKETIKGNTSQKPHYTVHTTISHQSIRPSEKLAERDRHLRESWVRAMEARLVREELEKCQKGEGVNHYENCKWLADKYITMLKENRVRPFFSL